MQSRTERKLGTLRQQKADLDAKIRKIEQEKQREIRKATHKRAGIIGALIQAKIEAGEEVHFRGERDLLAFLDVTLTRKADRVAFGLDTPSISPLPNDQSLKTTTAQEALPISPENIAPITTGKAQTTTPKTTKKRLPASPQNSMAKEFNL